jgi:hypothetical protein
MSSGIVADTIEASGASKLETSRCTIAAGVLASAGTSRDNRERYQ